MNKTFIILLFLCFLSACMEIACKEKKYWQGESVELRLIGKQLLPMTNQEYFKTKKECLIHSDDCKNIKKLCNSFK